jgi:hypothetical protein
MSLNTIKVQNLKPKKADYRLADGGGLYLLVRPGGSKLWRYDYRLTDRVGAHALDLAPDEVDVRHVLSPYAY